MARQRIVLEGTMMQDPAGVTYWAYDALDRSFRQEGIP
jgi:hypothetical protein